MIAHIERETLAEQVSRTLLASIRADGLVPGDRLPAEGALAVSFGVSRPVVREAMVQLRSLGVIDIRSGRPAIIKPMDASLPRAFFDTSVILYDKKSDELFEVRRCLEVQSAALAARRATPEQRSDLEEIVSVMGMRLASGDYGGFVDADVIFHLGLARTTGNEMLRHLIEGITEPVRESIRLGLVSRNSADQIRELQAVHERIVAGVVAQDEDAAAFEMGRHFDGAIAAIKATGA